MTSTNVFVYGSLLEGLGNHPLLEDSPCIARVSLQPIYTMYSLGGFPGVCMGGESRIVGELYTVSDVILSNLDCLEGHPNFYKRQKILTGYGMAWIYLLPPNYFENDDQAIPNGDWKSYVNSRGD